MNEERESLQPPPTPEFPNEDEIRAEEAAYVARAIADLQQSERRSLRDLQAAQMRRFHWFNRFDVLKNKYSHNDQLLLCEGDSWFRHPFLVDIPECLKDHMGFS